jgi:putative addiction module killer protein
VYEVEQTEEFEAWLGKLRDRKAAARIAAAIQRLGMGLIADWKAVGGGVHEIRLVYGPGYRVYFTFQGKEVILLLCGGDKSSQKRDITKAKKLKEEYSNG